MCDDTICPYDVLKEPNRLTYCNDGWPSTTKGTNGIDRCDAYIFPAIITDLCSAQLCAVEYIGKDNKKIEAYLPCDANRCPFVGCGRHIAVAPVPANIIGVILNSKEGNNDNR